MEDNDYPTDYETPLGEQIDSGMEEPDDRMMTDAEADANVFTSIGWGTDEDYGHYND